MEKKLTPLKEFNLKARQSHWDFLHGNPVLNGIACPMCGGELYDSMPSITLASNPPQKNVHCSNCKFCGYRIA